MIERRLGKKKKDRDHTVAEVEDVLAKAEGEEEAFPFTTAKKRS